jgi:hypothetical protein
VKREIFFSAFWALAFLGWSVAFALRADEACRAGVRLYFYTNLLGVAVSAGYGVFFAWTAVSLLCGRKP